MDILSEIKPSLPSSWYFDPDHYDRELRAIWHQDWVCVGRAEELPRAGDYRVTSIGTQKIIVTRNTEGQLRAFHNTCRHRGSLLCRESEGRFRNGRIICPYHTWTYSTDGELLTTPGRLENGSFDKDRFPLYSVHLDTWKGFVFVCLADEPAASLVDFIGDEKKYIENWPIESMHSVSQQIIPVACNWKIFWENYSECYHCPRVHPELCKVTPIYKKAVFDATNLPDWEPAYDGDDGSRCVGDGARTWTMDGQLTAEVIDGPNEQEIEAGVTFTSITGSMYVVGHPDYVRSVRVLPTGPESIELVVDWLWPDDRPDPDDATIESIVALGRLVVEQDGDVCELNQAGLKSPRHEEGVLVAQEYELWGFHEWLRDRLDNYDD